MSRLLRMLSILACLTLPLLGASAASAAERPVRTGNPDYTVVPPATPPPATAAPAAVSPNQVAAAPPVSHDRLAVTGSDVLQTGLIGSALIAVGGVVVLATRRRTA